MPFMLFGVSSFMLYVCNFTATHVRYCPVLYVALGSWSNIVLKQKKKKWLRKMVDLCNNCNQKVFFFFLFCKTICQDLEGSVQTSMSCILTQNSINQTGLSKHLYGVSRACLCISTTKLTHQTSPLILQSKCVFSGKLN